MIDHMLGGRLVFGISPGGLRSDAEVFGNLDRDRRAMFAEAIEQVLAIWRGEPSGRRCDPRLRHELAGDLRHTRTSH